MISYMESFPATCPNPSGTPPSAARELAKIALNRLIEDKILAQEVERLKIKVSDAGGGGLHRER